MPGSPSLLQTDRLTFHRLGRRRYRTEQGLIRMVVNIGRDKMLRLVDEEGAQVVDVLPEGEFNSRHIGASTPNASVAP